MNRPILSWLLRDGIDFHSASSNIRNQLSCIVDELFSTNFPQLVSFMVRYWATVGREILD